jgi:RNA polymerase sigma-70 factor (ECF subfamily)
MDHTELRDSLMALHTASFGWALSCCRDRELAEEVLQSVYAKVLDGQACYRSQASFRTWLFAVIRNASRDQRRKRWWTGVLRLDFDVLAKLADVKSFQTERIHDQDDLTVIRAALAKLPERQQQIAHLVFYEDMKIVEAASVMGVSLGTARQHYARAKESLRVTLVQLRNDLDEPTFK